MGFLYHGSKEHGLKRLEPRESTHGVYVYATYDKVLALNFSSRCGDDLVYSIGRTDNNMPWNIVERVPGAFDKMYSNSSSIYSFSDETFKDIHTGFCEVVSEVGVDIENEEYCENVFEGLLEAQKEGLVKLYRYPNKPLGFKEDNSDFLDQWRRYKNNLNKEFSKNKFDRLFYLHPYLLNQINDLAKEFNYDYNYEPNDLIDIFSNMIDKQLSDLDCERYIESAYINICNTFPNLKPQIDELYYKYVDYIKNNDKSR